MQPTTENHKSTLEIHYQVWEDNQGVFINVGPDGDVGGYPQIRTIGKESEEFFGKLDLILRPDLARKLGQALIRCADDCEKVG